MKNIYQIETTLKNIKNNSNGPGQLWNPDFCGNLDIRIARDGTWFYCGSKINRKKLVQLFSRIIRKEGDKYFLVTPVEKIGIVVDDAPFVVDNFDIKGTAKKQILYFTTQVGDIVTLSKDNPLRIEYDSYTQEPSPYILIRNNLEALIDRKSFYRLVDVGRFELHKDKKWFGFWSNGSFFPIMLESQI